MSWLLCPALIKRCFCLTSNVCLSVAYIGRNARTERPRKTKIGTKVAHVTRDSDTTFKVKRSKVKVTSLLWLVVLAGRHGHTVMATYPYAYMTYMVTCHRLQACAGTYRGGCPPTACYDGYYVHCLFQCFVRYFSSHNELLCPAMMMSDVCLSDVCLTSVCLSVAYIGPQSRT